MANDERQVHPVEFAERYGPWAVVAGASEGVGASVARLLGERGVNVVLVARRPSALGEVAATVGTETRTVALDLSRPDADQALAAATGGLEVGLLVYNAGADPFASRFLDQPLDPGPGWCAATWTPSSPRRTGTARPWPREGAAAS